MDFEILESGVGEMIQPPDLDAFREWNRTKKSRRLVDKRMTEQEEQEERRPLLTGGRMACCRQV